MKLKLSGVTRSVGREVHIHPTDLELGSGLNVLLGPTLAGKTSLLRLMAGLDRPPSKQCKSSTCGGRALPVSIAALAEHLAGWPGQTRP